MLGDEMRERVGKTFVLLVLLVASHTSPSVAADHAPELHGTGVVVALLPPPSNLHATRPVIVIHHDPLLPLMPEAMDMPFLAASTALFANIRAGDRIVFTLRETADALVVVAIERARP
jgi:Cu/Ag efflux protein CusF